MTIGSPYHVFGIVSDGGTPSNNAKVYAKDITLGSSIISVTTGSNGRYILDLSSIADDGDTISVWCFSSDGKYKSISFTLDISGADEQQNLAVVGLTPSDSIAIADNIGRTMSFKRSPADNITIGDNIGRVGSFVRATGDNLTIADNIGRVGSFVRAANDSVAIADNIGRVASYVRAVNDTSSITDILGYIKAMTLAINDNITIADDISRVGSFVRAANDSIAISDDIGTATTYNKTTSDNIAITDNISRVASYILATNDTINIGDSIDRTMSYVRATSDTVSITDIAGYLKAMTLSINDSINIVDDINYIGSYVRSPADNIAIADNITRTMSYIRNINISWLSDWKYRIKATIKNTNVDDDLTHFPMALFINAASGISDDDLTAVFTELGANKQKIAVTMDDGITQLYAEVDSWDNANETAVIWISKSDWTVTTAVDTVVYLYYDSTKDDNTTYVGISPDDTPTHNVWDSNYVMVQHMNDATTSTIKDSTVNNNDGTKKAANTPIEIDGKIGKGQDFDETHTEYINCGTNVKLGTTTPYTIQTWLKFTNDINNDAFFLGKAGNHWGFWYSAISGVKRIYFDTYTSADVYKTTYTNAVVSNTWYLVTGIYDSSGYDNIYLNGNYVRQVNVGTNRNYNSITLYLGRVSTLYMDGIIDEVRISNIARAAEWIKAEYYSQTDDIIEWDSPEPYQNYYDNDTAITIADNINRTMNYNRIINDTITILDNITRTMSYNRDINELIPITDNLIRIMSYNRNINDNITITDSLIRIMSYYRNIIDNINITDNINRVVDYNRTITDIMTIMDNITKTITYYRTKLDNITITDTLVKTTNYNRSITDTMTITDILTYLHIAFGKLLLTLENKNRQKHISVNQNRQYIKQENK